MNIQEAFKEIIKERMAERGMTVYALHRDAKIPQSTAYGFCDPKKASASTDIETAERIAKAVGFKLSTAARLAEGLRKSQLEVK